MKKLFCLITIFLCLFSLSASYAEDAPEFTKKDAYIFYEVSDQILMCQNKQEDMVKGTAEFEKTLLKHYKKRFNVIGFERTYMLIGADEKFPAEEKKKIFDKAQHALPILIKIDLLGNSTATDTYQNTFGAKKTITVPTTTIGYAELFGSPADNAFWGHYIVEDYRPGTYSILGELFANNVEPRKLTKTCLEAFIRDMNKYNPPNKYTDPQGYNDYWAIYTGTKPETGVALFG